MKVCEGGLPADAAAGVAGVPWSPNAVAQRSTLWASWSTSAYHASTAEYSSALRQPGTFAAAGIQPCRAAALFRTPTLHQLQSSCPARCLLFSTRMLPAHDH